MQQKKSNRFMPLWLALAAVVGIVVGTVYSNLYSNRPKEYIKAGQAIAGPEKLNSLLHLIEDQYVDSVDMADMIEKTIPLILGELDPHSIYIPTQDVEIANDDLRGSFSGVGIEFIIRNDTLRVQNVITDGPAEQAGVLPGDKIILVDDSTFSGPDLTNEEAMHRLKGPQGTKVKLSIQRYGETALREITVTRDEIPMHSVTATYMLDETTGYIKMKNFGENTYRETLVALARLSQQGFENLVIDLRGNSGGYLQSATMIANEFLPGGRIITYTEGVHSPRQDYESDGRGSYKRIPLVVLIDEGSASASEILAGAIQDNDRGTIIGRRSFGKGLVQQPIDFVDGSMVRFTVARYYSPSGRCIQKPYTSGMDREYEEDLLMRYQNGEFYSQDSIKHTGPEYFTRLGRVVYGGGGITPDIFIPEDTTDYTSYYKEALMSGLILQFGYDYTDQNRQRLSNYTNEEQLLKFLKRQNLVEQFVQYADQRGLKRRNLMVQRSHKLLEQFIFSRIIYNMLDEQSWMQYLNQNDPAIIEALRLFKENSAFPQPPAEEEDDEQKVAMSYDYRLTHQRYTIIART